MWSFYLDLPPFHIKSYLCSVECIALKKLCWRPSPHFLRKWLYMEIRSLQSQLGKGEVRRVALIWWLVAGKFEDRHGGRRMYSSVSVESVTGVTQDKLRTAVPIPSWHPDFRPRPPEGEMARFPGFKLPAWPCHYSSPKNPRSSFHSSTSNCHFASLVKHFIIS